VLFILIFAICYEKIHIQINSTPIILINSYCNSGAEFAGSEA